MKTRYPIEYKRGKLVKYLKPHRYVKYYDIYTTDVQDKTLDELVGWVGEHGGEAKDAYFEYEYEYGCDGHMELKLKIDSTKKEIEAQEKKYENQLKEWEEWKLLSKEAKITEEYKNKATRAKALKTQENNLLAKLRRIREQQEKI